MKKKTLFYIDCIDGHYLEYMHHLYMNCDNIKDENFVFMVPPAFNTLSDKLQWPKFSNVEIKYISANDIKKINVNGIRKSFNLCNLLKKSIEENIVSDVFLISLMGFMPFLPFFVDKKVKVSGIIYLIYLYRWRSSNIKTRFLDSIKYFIFSKSKIFSKIFLLNDVVAPVYLNKKFKTSVFRYLPDPFMHSPKNHYVDFRTKWGVSDEIVVCLHFGALTKRKGTIDILKAIINADKSSIGNCCFVFAGKIFDDIQTSFYSLVGEAQSKSQIIVFDEFCDYEFINSLCYSSDFILIPYKNPEQSSGVIGYAAQFKIPVIAPKNGLLGKLVRRNRLGFTFDDIDSSGLHYFFNNIENFKMKVDSRYLVDKTIPAFNNLIFR
ncbi:glycosyltransferase family protein [Flavobacterium nackdongense]|uniref:Glycosyltransferase family 1 protein n=1 Tax=Flavobacterium nackdongense TaxID=2547394 RepID=A0A4P6Y9V5_9FLAO|nr:glycosyltransferase [Flavobacterium nackdongense]QBN19799.1 glycosyltransferase family 1 protein [Flavobacterium nackdongense]